MANDSLLPTAAAVAGRPRVLGIWRLGDRIHRSDLAEVTLAQPADAAGSPRWDYVIKRAVGAEVDPEGRLQISRYIGSATSTSHPNLVAVLDGSVTGASPYVVMPRLEGQSMQQMLETSSSQPLPVALWFVRQAAQALSALHAAGWVHGDVKPANLFVGSSGHLTLVDLSFASKRHTPFGPLFRGTPRYASPELLDGGVAALPAMDVFALGRVLWQWLTHVTPTEPADLESVAGLVERMVRSEPAERPAATQVAAELLQLEIATLGGHIGPSDRRQHAA